MKKENPRKMVSLGVLSKCKALGLQSICWKPVIWLHLIQKVLAPRKDYDEVGNSQPDNDFPLTHISFLLFATLHHVCHCHKEPESGSKLQSKSVWLRQRNDSLGLLTPCMQWIGGRDLVWEPPRSTLLTVFLFLGFILFICNNLEEGYPAKQRILVFFWENIKDIICILYEAL